MDGGIFSTAIKEKHRAPAGRGRGGDVVIQGFSGGRSSSGSSSSVVVPVELVLAGHVHFYDRDVIEGEKQVLQLVGGAGFRGEAILIHITGGE